MNISKERSEHLLQARAVCCAQCVSGCYISWRISHGSYFFSRVLHGFPIFPHTGIMPWVWLAVSDWRIGRPSSVDVSTTGGPFPIRFRLPAAAGSHRSREKEGSNVAGGAIAWQTHRWACRCCHEEHISLYFVTGR